SGSKVLCERSSPSTKRPIGNSRRRGGTSLSTQRVFTQPGSKAAIQNHSHIAFISEGWWNVCPYFWASAEVFALLQLF
ncbi:MAG: hypothetical protein WBG81_12565, partial [Rhodanobacter sp.]